MTLNQVVKKVEQIVLSHKQVRSFKVAHNKPEELNDHKRKYPAAFLSHNNANVSFSPSGILSIDFRLAVLDLVHVVADTKENEADVLSDTMSILLDIVAIINDSTWDWVFSQSNSLEQATEYDNDMSAGWFIDFTIQTVFKQDRCVIPADIIDNPTNDTDVKVYDEIYIAAGDEGSTLTIPILVGKKIIFASRENNVLYKVSNGPISSEFTWNNQVVGLGAPAEVNERFLFLYRNY